MDFRELAEEFCQMRIVYAKKMADVEKALSAKGEANVLLFLYSFEQEILAGQIAKNLELSPSRVTNILNSLDKKRLIKKRIDSSDKRRVYISLTEYGKQYIKQKHQDVVSRYENIFRQLGIQDAQNYIRIMKKFSALIEKDMEAHSADEEFN